MHKTFFKHELSPLPNKEKPTKQPKPIPKVSEKKKERLRTEGSELGLFKKLCSERKMECEQCCKPIRNPAIHHFDHVKAKGMNKDLRLDPNNIRILCYAHHFERTTGLKYKGIDLD